MFFNQKHNDAFTSTNLIFICVTTGDQEVVMVTNEFCDSGRLDEIESTSITVINVYIK